MARKRPAPKYAGALAKPIYVDLGSLELDRYPDIETALKEMWWTRAAEKLELLCKHYKIDPSDEKSLEKLALKLAFKHVPGLQIAFRPKRGRKLKWKAGLGDAKSGLGDELVRAVQDLTSQPGVRTQDAIRRLQENNPETWGRYTVGNLGARYREAKRQQEQFRKLVEAARELQARGHKLDGLLALLLPDENSARPKTSRRK